MYNLPPNAKTEVNSTFRSQYLLWQSLTVNSRRLIKSACKTVVDDVRKSPVSRNSLNTPAITTQSGFVVGLDQDEIQCGIINRMIGAYQKDGKKSPPGQDEFMAVVTGLTIVKLLEKEYTADKLNNMLDKQKKELSKLFETLKTKSTFDEDLKAAMMKKKLTTSVTKITGTLIDKQKGVDYSIVKHDKWVMTDLPDSILNYLRSHAPMPLNRDEEKEAEIRVLRVDQVCIHPPDLCLSIFIIAPLCLRSYLTLHRRLLRLRRLWMQPRRLQLRRLQLR